MKLQNFRINKGVPAILLLSLVLVACGGGSVDSNSGSSAAAQTGIAPATTVPTVAAPSTISAPSTIAGCSTTGATGAIALSNVPSRTTGVAPLSVFFDATGTTATATKQPFHDLEYRWDFGNPAGSPVNGTTWKTGSKAGVNSRNTATGPETSHVYETPGTYTVALTATDGTNKVSSCTQIVVQDPNTVFSGTNTICVGATSTPVQGQDGCPAGAAVATQSNFATAVNTYLATGKRILFKHDDTFGTTTTASVAATGPGIIGMYGVGAKPKILATTTIGNGIIRLGAPTTYTMQDWRIMDLDFDGQSNAGNTGFKINGVADQITLLRMNVHNIGSGVLLEASVLEYYMATNGYTEHMFDQFSVADSAFTNINGTYGLFMWSNHLSILGTTVDNAGGGLHAVRVMHATGGVVSNNTFGNPSPTHQVFTLRASSYTDCRPTSGCEYYPNLMPGTAVYTTKVVVSDNHFIGGASNQPVTVTPSNSSIDDGRFKDIILERNWYTGAGATCCMPMLDISAQYVTVRNELIDMTGAGAKHKGIIIERAGSKSLGSDNVKLFNNTIFSNDAGDFSAVAVHVPTTNITVVNNLAYSPNISGLFYDVCTMCGAPTVSSNNTATTNQSPSMVTIPPTTTVGFSPATGSYAIGTGIVVPVWSDFFSTPQTATRDMGAIKGR